MQTFPPCRGPASSTGPCPRGQRGARRGEGRLCLWIATSPPQVSALQEVPSPGSWAPALSCLPRIKFLSPSTVFLPPWLRHTMASLPPAPFCPVVPLSWQAMGTCVPPIRVAPFRHRDSFPSPVVLLQTISDQQPEEPQPESPSLALVCLEQAKALLGAERRLRDSRKDFNCPCCEHEAHYGRGELNQTDYGKRQAGVGLGFNSPTLKYLIASKQQNIYCKLGARRGGWREIWGDGAGSFWTHTDGCQVPPVLLLLQTHLASPRC